MGVRSEHSALGCIPKASAIAGHLTTCTVLLCYAPPPSSARSLPLAARAAAPKPIGLRPHTSPPP
eukprot:SAG11_NODE_24514_length_372_cov_0.879121_1_plen_64_part_10